MFIYKQPFKAHLCLIKNIQYILCLKATSFSFEIYINASLFSVEHREGPNMWMFSLHK